MIGTAVIAGGSVVSCLVDNKRGSTEGRIYALHLLWFGAYYLN